MKLRQVLPLLAVVCVSVFSSAQLDPRERYGTYLGGSQATCVDNAANNACGGAASSTTPASTQVTAVAVDPSGNIYVAGGTNAVDFPTTAGAYSRTVAHATPYYVGPLLSSDSFVAKFSSGGRLVWSTYLGVPFGRVYIALTSDAPKALAADSSRHAF